MTLEISNATIQIRGHRIIDDLSMTLDQGERVREHERRFSFVPRFVSSRIDPTNQRDLAFLLESGLGLDHADRTLGLIRQYKLRADIAGAFNRGDVAATTGSRANRGKRNDARTENPKPVHLPSPLSLHSPAAAAPQPPVSRN